MFISLSLTSTENVSCVLRVSYLRTGPEHEKNTENVSCVVQAKNTRKCLNATCCAGQEHEKMPLNATGGMRNGIPTDVLALPADVLADVICVCASARRSTTFVSVTANAPAPACEVWPRTEGQVRMRGDAGQYHCTHASAQRHATP